MGREKRIATPQRDAHSCLGREKYLMNKRDDSKMQTMYVRVHHGYGLSFSVAASAPE